MKSPLASPLSIRALGVVLAGGKSRRMGTDKAGALLGNRTLLDWMVTALSQVVPEVVVVGRERAEGVRSIPDIESGGRGPAAGIATGLLEAGDRPVLAVGVDQPWVRPATLAAMLEVQPLPVVPLDVRYQITCAVYPAKALPLVTEAAGKARSLQPVIPRLGGTVILPEHWRSWGEDGRSWFSVDTPEDLAEGLRRYGSPGG